MSCPEGECQVCYTDFTQDNYIIICWNEHALCKDCYEKQIKPRTTVVDYGDGNSLGYRANVSTKCPFDREVMFDWFKHAPSIEEEVQTLIDIVRSAEAMERMRLRLRQETRERIRRAARIRRENPNGVIPVRQQQREQQRQLRQQQRQQRQGVISILPDAPPRRVSRCGNCSQEGHNRRTCPN
tara:strand:- start:11301 stop:11849 length:549 start_codon:yes stop_codon:yes gene_type:complete